MDRKVQYVSRARLLLDCHTLLSPSRAASRAASRSSCCQKRATSSQSLCVLGVSSGVGKPFSSMPTRGFASAGGAGNGLMTGRKLVQLSPRVG